MHAPPQLPSEGGEIGVGGQVVGLSTLDRMLFPASRFAKRDLVAYYLAVADAIIPHLRRRPLTMARFPDGLHGRGFLQNECRGAPVWMPTVALALRTGVVRRYCLIDGPAALAWVANLSTVELHPYPVVAEDPDRPVALVLDLDPGPGACFHDCLRVALRLRELLDDAPVAVKSSGGRGLHLARAVTGATFDETRATARRLAERLVAELPDLVTADARPAARRGRVLLDWLQNASRRSTIAPYSLRAADPPSASLPLAWEEVEALAAGPRIEALAVTPADVVRRLDRHGDLFAAALAPSDHG